jgi:hypothetical protein
MEEKKRGGPRLGAGRKPVDNKKMPVTFYVPENIIEAFKKQGEVLIQDLTTTNVEIKPKETPKSNFRINTSKKKEKPANEEKRGSSEENKPVGDIEKQIQAIMNEDRPANMSYPQWMTSRRKRIEHLKSQQ